MTAGTPRPPRFGRRLMSFFLGRGEHYSLIGDIDELFAEKARDLGLAAARRWYVGQVLRFFPSYVFHGLIAGWPMMGSYLRTGLRNIKKQKVQAFINVFGLAVGMAGAILLLLYVSDELSFDNFHAQQKSLYRIDVSWLGPDGGVKNRSASLPAAVVPLLRSYFPEIESAVLFGGDQVVMRAGDRMISEALTFTNPEVFRTFSFPLLEGNPDTALARDADLVLTRSAAGKLFGAEDPVGRRVTLTFGVNKKDFVVSGVAADVPRNSTIQFKALVRTDNLTVGGYKEALTNLGDFSHPVYLKLKDGTPPDRIAGRFEAFIGQAFGAEFAQWGEAVKNGGRYPIALSLQPLRKIHFHDVDGGGNDPSNILLLAGIAGIVLLIGCINFINLAVGRAAARGGEIGMRKVIGAQRRQVLNQFLSESLLLVAAAFLAAIVLAALFLPAFDRLSNKTFALADLFRPAHLLGFGALLLVVAAASGGYPALLMSRIKPVQAFRGRLSVGSRRTLTKALVVIQFALSIFLIVSTLVLGRQVRFLVGKDPGFDKSGLLSVRVASSRAEEVLPIVERFREKTRSLPDVRDVGATSVALGQGWSRGPLKKGGVEIPMYQFHVDPFYIRTMGLRLVQGRDFYPDSAADADSAIVSREFCRRLGLADPIGRRIGEFVDGKMGEYPNKLTIVGVIEDFNNLSFKNGLEPILLHRQPGWGLRNMIVRIRMAGVSGTLRALEAAWKEVQPDRPFEFSFVEDDLASQYASETRWNGIIRASSIFAVIIASLGIFGLTALSVRRRFKEIGIRKVLGASVGRVFALISGEMLVLVAAANVVAGPLVYYAMRKVLNNYYYRVAIGPADFLAAAGLSLLVAFLTMSFLALKASLADPVRAIHWE